MCGLVTCANEEFDARDCTKTSKDNNQRNERWLATNGKISNSSETTHKKEHEYFQCGCWINL
jgi:hypothetical protein